jgi:hypothetical protein
MGLGSVPWIDDPDAPDYMSEAAIERMAERLSEKLGPPKKSLQEDWQQARDEARKWLKRAWNEAEHPRDPVGSETGGQFTSGEGGASSAKPKGKKKATKADFDRAKIKIDVGSAEQQDAFIAKWNDKIGEDPATFKQEFMGGLDGTMALSGSGNSVDINGEIAGKGAQSGVMVGTFTRQIDLDRKSAYSAYFRLNKSATKSDIGKQMLAGNIETYERLGIEKVGVTANIDVGGYAWAKYGYVPTQDAWNSLRGKLQNKLGGRADSGSRRGDNTVEADDWNMLSSDVQDDVRDRWIRDSYDEFLSSEEQSWRESGQALEDAKREWANDVMETVRVDRGEAGEPPIPYTNRQIYQALDLEEYESKYSDGADDPEFTFDDDKLRELSGHDPNQPDLPSIPLADLSKRLTEDMRDALTGELTTAFNKKAEENADDAEPPSYLAESVGEYQGEYWDQKTDAEKLQHAIDYGMADIEIEPDDEEEEEQQLDLPPPTPGENQLLAAVRSADPKSIWKVADSPQGKQLLLGTSWSGVLNLNDPESMKRFKDYVGRTAYA